MFVREMGRYNLFPEEDRLGRSLVGCYRQVNKLRSLQPAPGVGGHFRPRRAGLMTLSSPNYTIWWYPQKGDITAGAFTKFTNLVTGNPICTMASGSVPAIYDPIFSKDVIPIGDPTATVQTAAAPIALDDHMIIVRLSVKAIAGDGYPFLLYSTPYKAPAEFLIKRTGLRTYYWRGYTEATGNDVTLSKLINEVGMYTDALTSTIRTYLNGRLIFVHTPATSSTMRELVLYGSANIPFHTHGGGVIGVEAFPISTDPDVYMANRRKLINLRLP
jgi:hypothetical protein